MVDDGIAAENSVFDTSLSDSLQKALEKARTNLKTDNLSASLYISDRCYWEGVVGSTKQDPAIAIDPNTLFGFGSITKTFVAGIVLQLAEERKLDLDASLGTWLPQYPNIDKSITVRQLLNHGSGLGGYYLNRRFWAALEADPDRLWQPGDTLKYVGPPQKPGATLLRYTNTNYTLLGMIVEAVTGNSLEEELHNRITGPLGLDSTHLPKMEFDPERWADSTRLSTSLYSSIWAAGAIASIPREIAKWTHALHSGHFLRPTSIEIMRVTTPRRIGRHGEIPMGLGVWKLSIAGKRAWGHGGRFEPFVSAAFYLPELDLSVAYSFSWTNGEGQSVPGMHLVRAYLDQLPEDISICLDS